ncbi:uncharacterized protein LOC110857488 isoform X2 [Folsomia candida]|uniref:uncharacterized protein LOC110857488 isoform X2 n=1 Tax=Folsomia candida TaxID=158441 RepID=UPI0016050B1B|nr:uncharacterized protein LOC110857488 isoform X2 [Folsomia candida]
MAISISKKFCVVQFLKENSFAAVPSKWIIEEEGNLMCRWPRGTQLLDLIKNPDSIPKKTWKKLGIKLFRSFGSDEYELANFNVDQAKVISGGESQSGSLSSDKDEVNETVGVKKTNNIISTDLSVSSLTAPPLDFNQDLELSPVSPTTSNNLQEPVILVDDQREGFTQNGDNNSQNAPDLSTPILIQTLPSESDKVFQETVIKLLVDLKTEVAVLSSKVASLTKFGKLDNISAFPFENEMQYIKRTLRSKRHPMQQMINRIHERQNNHKSKIPVIYKGLGFSLKSGSVVTCKKGNNVVLLNSGECVLINYINNDICEGFKFKTVKSLYDHPCQSQNVHMYLCADIDTNKIQFKNSCVKSKCYMIPHLELDTFVCVALL